MNYQITEVMEEFDLLGKFPVAGLAKQNEELFLHGKADDLPPVVGDQKYYQINKGEYVNANDLILIRPSSFL